MNGMCVHCEKHIGTRGRGLCYRCHLTPSIRKQYAPRCNRRGYARSDRPACWACGKQSPVCTFLARRGWHVLPHRAGHRALTEVYCPECFAEWGWPDWESFDREHPDNAALQVPR